MSARQSVVRTVQRATLALLALLFGTLSLLAAPVAQAATAVGAATYENTAAAVTYSGTWASSSSSQDSGGSVSTLAGVGYAQLTFQESSVKIIARTANYYGVANVYLDGTQVASIDQYSSTTTFKTVAYSSPTLSFGTHTLRVERAGTKNDASSGRTINLDSFVVADTRAPATPSGLVASAVGAGARLTWSPNGEDDLAGYLVYRMGGSSTTYVSVAGSPVTDTSYADPSLVPTSTYHYRVTAVDKSGNESSRSADATMTANDTAVGPGPVENTASAITYAGTWTSSASSLDSGGSISSLAVSGSAQLGFRGTGVKFTARTANYYGIANVYLDDTLVSTVDQYSSSAANRVVVYSSTALPFGVHTIRLERSGTKNDASSGRSINLDTFVVVDDRPPATPTGLVVATQGSGARLSWDANGEGDLGGYLVQRAIGSSSSFTTLNDAPLIDSGYTDPALVPGTTYRYRVSAIDTSGNESARSTAVSVTADDTTVGAGTTENTTSDITYNGAWTTSSSSLDSGGSVSTLASNGFAQLAFRETSVKIIARTASYYGIANVYVDDTLSATIDQYSSSTAFKTVAWTSPALPFGVHTVRIERSGAKNDASSGRTINLDSVVVLDSRPPSSPDGLTATAEGSGVRLNWSLGTEDDLAGYVVYRAAGTSSSYVTLNSTPASGSTFLDPALDPDTTYRYRLAAVDTSGNVSSETDDVSITSRVSVAETGTVESSSDMISFVGPWTTASSTSDSGGSSVQLAAAGYAQIAFKETQIKFVARTANYFGIANVYLDGVLVSTVDLYSDAPGYKTMVWTSPTLAYDTHTLRVERSGNKNDASTGRTISVDCFVVPDTQSPTIPTGLDAAPEGTGIRVRWDAATDSTVDSYRVYRADAGSSTFDLVGDSVSGTSYADSGLTPGTTYRYRVTAIDTSGNESDPASEVAALTAVGPGSYPGAGRSAVLTGDHWSGEVDATTQRDEGVVTTGPGTASLTFLEGGVRWVGSTGPEGGIARVYVDDALVTSVSQYSAAVRRDVPLFETSSLGEGAHTIKVSWSMDHDNSVSGVPQTSVKAFVVPDTTPPAAPRSVWALPSGNGIDLEWNDAPDTDTVGYRVYRAKGTDALTPLVTLAQRDTSYLDPTLTPGTSYRYQVTAVDASGNESKRSAEAMATTALSTGTVENTSAAITYSTPWSTSSSTRDSGGSYSSLGAPGDARFTFSGTGVKWVTRTNNFSGIGQVYLDGTAVGKVDLYSATQQYQQVVWSTNVLTDGTHTIRIERTGTMNASSTGRNLTLDAFVVTDSTAPPTVPGPSVTNTRLGTQVSWTASSAADVAAYNLLRTGPDGVETVLDRLPPSQLSFLDVGLAAGTIYRFRVTAIDTSGNESKPGSAVAITTPGTPAPVRERYGSCPTATRAVSTASGLQSALKNASAGDVIVLAPGTYTGSFSTSVAGTQTSPVWICGPRSAVIDFKDPTAGTGFSFVGARWVTVTGMTVQNVQKGIVVSGGSRVTVSDIHFADIGEEAVHLRSATVDSAVVGNLIERTGLSVPQYGEGVYIGSDPGAWCTYSSCGPDRSDRNSVLDNTMTGVTAEAVDAKAGTSDGTITGNTVDGALMTPANSDGLIVVKGNGWFVARNTATAAPVNGLTATYSKAEGWGGGNVFVANNVAVGNETGYGVWMQRGINNIVGCDNSAPGGVRIANLVCQR